MADNASSEAVFSTRITRIGRNRKRGSKSPARAIWIWLSTGISSLLRVLRRRGARNYRICPPPRRARLRPTNMGGSRKIQIPLPKQTAHLSNPSNSPPTTLVTGSRKDKTSSSRAFGASRSQPASMSTGSSLKETRSTAFPPMQPGEWAINRIQSRALRRNGRSRSGRMESLPGVICPRTWPALSTTPVLPLSSNRGPSSA